MFEPFAIASLPTSGGGRIGLCPLPGRGGDLEGDLAVVADWGPDLLVAMTEASETGGSAVGAAGTLLQNRGIERTVWPVRDFGVPDDAARAAWPALSRRIHLVLDRGGRVLFHCHGGRGRSGMAVLRVLVERGCGAGEALARLRAVRPGAVETGEQEKWARQQDIFAAGAPGR